MRKITEKQLEDMIFYKRARTNPLTIQIDKLKIGELLLIEKKDWKKSRATLYSTVFSSFRDKKFQFKSLADSLGYVVKRIN